MPDKTIRIKTEGDIAGSTLVLNHLKAIQNVARDISKNGLNIGFPGQTSGSSTQVAAVAGVATMQSQKQFHAQRGHVAAQQELQGHIETMQVQAVEARTSGVPVPRSYRGYRPAKGTIDLPQDYAREMSARLGTPERAGQWFNEFRRFMFNNPGSVSAKQLAEYQKVMTTRSMSGISGFYQKHAAEANMIGSPPLTPIQSFRAGFGGSSAAGSSWDSAGVAGGMGNAMGGILPFLRSPAGMAVAGVAGVGMLAKGTWDTGMKQGEALSGLSKQIGDGANSLSGFISKLDQAGAALGYLPEQVARIANIVGPLVGNVGNKGMVTASRNIMKFSRQQGLPGEYVAQNYGLAAQMGLTMGAGAGMGGAGFLGMVSDLSTGSMKGRSADVMDELLTAAKQIQSIAVVLPSMTGLADIVSQFNNTGFRQTQGAAGAQLIGKITQGIANPGLGGAGEAMTLKALGAPDYLTGRYWQQMGPSFVPPGKNKTNMQATLGYLTDIFGKPDLKKQGNQLVPGNQGTMKEMYFLSQLWGMSMPEAAHTLNASEMPGMKKGSGIKGKVPLTDTEYLNKIEAHLVSIRTHVGDIATKIVGSAVRKNDELSKKAPQAFSPFDFLKSFPSVGDLFGGGSITHQTSFNNTNPMSISMAGGLGAHMGFNYMMASMSGSGSPSLLQTSLPTVSSPTISPNVSSPVEPPGPGMLSGDTMKSYIVQKSMSLGLDPKAVLSVAIQEGGFKGAIGDSGSSFGPFQLHKGGALPKDKYGNAQQWANSSEGIDYALGRIATVAKGKTGSDAINAIVRRFERPASPDREVRNAISAYNSSSLDATIKQLISAMGSLSKSMDKVAGKNNIQLTSLHPATGIIKNV